MEGKGKVSHGSKQKEKMAGELSSIRKSGQVSSLTKSELQSRRCKASMSIDIPTGRRSWTEIYLKQGFNANKYQCSIFDYEAKAGMLDVKVGGSYDLSN